MLDSRKGRYQSLDIWRGVACLMIVIIHSSYYLLGHPEQFGEDLLAKTVGFFPSLLSAWSANLFCHQRLLHYCNITFIHPKF